MHLAVDEIFGDEPPMHCMTFAEREQLKQFARRAEGLTDVLIAIAHWMRCAQDISFSAYIANWAVAQMQANPSVRSEWPLSSPRMIADGSTEWGSYLSKTSH